MGARWTNGATPIKPLVPTGRAILWEAIPANPDLSHFRDDREGKFIAAPIILDDRCHHAFRECTHACDQRPLPLVKNIDDPVEITIDCRLRVSRLLGQRSLHACHLFLPRLHGPPFALFSTSSS